MDREDILKAVQTEKQETGEYEDNIARKAIMFGTALGVILCLIMTAVELWIFKKLDFGKPTMLIAISSFANLYEGRKCKEKKKIVGGLIEAMIAVFCLLLYVGAFLV